MLNAELDKMLVTANNFKDGLKSVVDKIDDNERNVTERATKMNKKLEAIQLIDERINKIKTATITATRTDWEHFLAKSYSMDEWRK